MVSSWYITFSSEVSWTTAKPNDWPLGDEAGSLCWSREVSSVRSMCNTFALQNPLPTRFVGYCCWRLQLVFGRSINDPTSNKLSWWWFVVICGDVWNLAGADLWYLYIYMYLCMYLFIVYDTWLIICDRDEETSVILPSNPECASTTISYPGPQKTPQFDSFMGDDKPRHNYAVTWIGLITYRLWLPFGIPGS